MNRIYLQIYASLIGAALFVLLGVSIAGHFYFERQAERAQQEVEGLAAALEAELETAPPHRAVLEEELRRHIQASELPGLRALVRSPDGDVLAAASNRDRSRLGRRRDERPRSPFRPGARHASAWTRVPLAEGAHLELSAFGAPRNRGGFPLLPLAAFFGVIALGAYPVARRLARGLEELEAGVSNLGEGDLSARVAVRGPSEVAAVADAFNRAASRIETLVASERRLLANASHEMRSPLARLRAAVELLADGHGDHLQEAERSIEELDALVGDLLLAARLESKSAPFPREEVDLFEVAQAEADRAGVRCSGESVPLSGNARLLSRLIRNLIDNADRYGSPPIEIEVQPGTDAAWLRVSDRGMGIPADQRERIFEPFYRPPGHSEGRDGGVGIGLALVSEIARDHGGQVRYRPREGGGSLFEVEFGASSRGA